MIGVRSISRSAPAALKSFPSRIPSAVRSQLLARTYSSAASTSTPSSTTSYSKLILAGVAVAAGSTLFLSTRSPVLAEAIQISEPNSLSTSIASLQTTKSSDRPTSSDVLSALRPEVLTDAHDHLEKADVGDLVKQYVVYLLSEQSYLVERGPWMLKQLEWTRDNVPVLGSLVWSAFSFGMGSTFYDVFVGGNSVAECADMVADFAQQGVGVALSYSAEASVDGSAAAAGGVIKAHITEACLAFTSASQFQPPRMASENFEAKKYEYLKPTMLAIKLSGLVYEPALLSRASSALTNSSAFARGAALPGGVLFPDSPELSDEDHVILKDLFSGLREICATGRDGGVRVLVDAEQSWFQPAIDHMVDLLAREFNQITAENSKDGPAVPIVHNTYQCYRRSAPESMAHSIALAEAGNYSFGAKLVRGAYVESERSRWVAAGSHGLCTIWHNKAETDACYDECAILLEKRVAKELSTPCEGRGKAGTGAFYASHNGTSARKVLEELRKDGLAIESPEGLIIDDRVRGRISFGQLMGMSDNLTNTLTGVMTPQPKSTDIPLVFKWVPYATIDQALPYLIRRANENQSILKSDPTSGRGGAKGERQALGKEMRKRMGLTF